MKSPPLEVCWTGSGGGGRVSAAMSGSGTERLAADATDGWAVAAAGAPSAAPASGSAFQKSAGGRWHPRSFFDM